MLRLLPTRHWLATAFIAFALVIGCLSTLTAPAFAQVNSYSQTNTTSSDGTFTSTVHTSNGTTITTTVRPDGSSTVTNKNGNTTVTTTTDAQGNVKVTKTP